MPFRALVIGLDEIPVSDARVELYLEDSLSWTPSNVPEPLDAATTDGQGQFEVRRVPKMGSYFIVGGDRVPLSSCAKTDQRWVLRIAREPNLRLDWERDSLPPTELEALDAGRGTLWIHTFVAGRADQARSPLELHGVRSHLLGVERSLAMLRMRFSDGSIETLLVQPEPNGLTQVTID
jgi:hypothetical protein